MCSRFAQIIRSRDRSGAGHLRGNCVDLREPPWHRADAVTGTTSRRWPGNSTPSSRRSYRGNIASMAWGARNFISTLTGTMLMFGFDCAARMTRRPILPNPLIPTRIDMVFLSGLRVDSVLCGCAVVGGGGGVSGDLCLRPPARGLPLPLGTALVRDHAVPIQPPASARAGPNTRPSPRGNFSLARTARHGKIAAGVQIVMQRCQRRATDDARLRRARFGTYVDAWMMAKTLQNREDAARGP